MGEAIPLSELAKMGAYDITLEEGITVKTRVVELSNTYLVDHFISELKSSLTATAGVVVIGVDVKYATKTSCFCMNWGYGHSSLLVLSTQTRCLIIQLCRASFSLSTGNFFKDEAICFVGMKSKLADLQFNVYVSESCVELGSGLDHVVDFGDLAARVLKNPGLETCSKMSKLAKEVGIPYEKTKKTGNWDARVFSHEQVKAAMTNAYTCCASASKLFTML